MNTTINSGVGGVLCEDDESNDIASPILWNITEALRMEGRKMMSEVIRGYIISDDGTKISIYRMPQTSDCKRRMSMFSS